MVVGTVVVVGVVVGAPPAEVVVGPDAIQDEVPNAVAQSMGAPERKRCRRAWTSNAATLGFPLESKSVPASEVPSHERSSRVSQLMNSTQAEE